LGTSTGCRKKAKEVDNKNMDHKVPASEQLGFGPSDKECKLEQSLDGAIKGTPEYALYRLFQVWKKAVDNKWKGDEDDLFEEWKDLMVRGHVPSVKGELKRTLAKLVQESDITQYIAPKAEELTIIICRQQKIDGGKTVKFYVRKDSKDTNPPVKITQDDDNKWVLNRGFRL
jgi:hypothetical protein